LDNGLLQERLPILDLAADKSESRSNLTQTNLCILDNEEIYHIFSDKIEAQNMETK